MLLSLLSLKHLSEVTVIGSDGVSSQDYAARGEHDFNHVKSTSTPNSINSTHTPSPSLPSMSWRMPFIVIFDHAANTSQEMKRHDHCEAVWEVVDVWGA